MRTNEIIANNFKENPKLNQTKVMVIEAIDMLEKAILNGGKILVCGNGGSASDAEHIVGELMKGFKKKRCLSKDEIEKFAYGKNEPFLSQLQSAIPAISLVSQTSLITAIANDISEDMIYAQQVYGYAEKGKDILIALSTSGKSKNIINAVKMANMIGIDSICITGSNSNLNFISKCCINLPSFDTDKIQEMTIVVYHTICEILEDRLFNI